MRHWKHEAIKGTDGTGQISRRTSSHCKLESARRIFLPERGMEKLGFSLSREISSLGRRRRRWNPSITCQEQHSSSALLCCVVANTAQRGAPTRLTPASPESGRKRIASISLGESASAVISTGGRWSRGQRFGSESEERTLRGQRPRGYWNVNKMI